MNILIQSHTVRSSNRNNLLHELPSLISSKSKLSCYFFFSLVPAFIFPTVGGWGENYSGDNQPSGSDSVHADCGRHFATDIRSGTTDQCLLYQYTDRGKF